MAAEILSPGEYQFGGHLGKEGHNPEMAVASNSPIYSLGVAGAVDSFHHSMKTLLLHSRRHDFADHYQVLSEGISGVRAIADFVAEDQRLAIVKLKSLQNLRAGKKKDELSAAWHTFYTTALIKMKWLSEDFALLKRLPEKFYFTSGERHQSSVLAKGITFLQLLVKTYEQINVNDDTDREELLKFWDSLDMYYTDHGPKCSVGVGICEYVDA